jgi:peptide/nickel transport system ATP-binding protein
VDEEPLVARHANAMDHGVACHYAEEIEVITASEDQEEK